MRQDDKCWLCENLNISTRPTNSRANVKDTINNGSHGVFVLKKWTNISIWMPNLKTLKKVKTFFWSRSASQSNQLFTKSNLSTTFHGNILLTNKRTLKTPSVAVIKVTLFLFVIGFLDVSCLPLIFHRIQRLAGIPISSVYWNIKGIARYQKRNKYWT